MAPAEVRARFACLTLGTCGREAANSWAGKAAAAAACQAYMLAIKKKYCQAFHGVRAKHELPLQPRDNCACLSLCGGEFLFECTTGIRETAHGSNHGRVANSHPNWWSQSCPAAAERERGGGKMRQRGMEWRRRGRSFENRQTKGSPSNESKVTETWLQLPI